MLTGYADFEIDIQPGDGKVFPFSVRSPGGEANGLLRLPTREPLYQQLADRLAALDTDEDLLDRLGQLLFDALIQGKVKEVYNRSQGTLQDRERQGLRIKLCIASTETEVAALPWEFLHDPDQIGPLALLDAPVVRYIPLPSIVPTLKTKLPLRVLLTGAQTPPQTDVERELREVHATLAVLGDYVQITFEPHLTPALLQRRLREGFDVWHFVGHGGFSADGATGQLLLENGRDAHSISAMELGVLLNRSGVRLIVLDTCDSARLATDPFRSLAPALVRAQIPAVVAMQFKVPEETTRVFAKTFYQALAEGFPIETCMTEGRKGVMNAVGLGRADWGIPVAYTHAPDGILFDLPTPLGGLSSMQIISNPTAGGGLGAAVANHPSGALLFQPSPATIERLARAPRPPRPLADFLDRVTVLDSLAPMLEPRRGAWLHGPRGCGRTALLRQAANLPTDRALPDGVVYVEGEIEPSHADDIVQRLFYRFYRPSAPMQIDPGTAQTYLGDLQALFILDSLALEHPGELAKLTDTLAEGAVLVTAEGESPGTFPDLPLPGLPRADAARLCATQAQLNRDQPDVAALLERLCAALDDLPLPLLLAARLIRCRAATLQQLVAVLEEMPRPAPQLLERAVGEDSNSSWPATPHTEQNGAHEPLVRAARLAFMALDQDELAVLSAVVAGKPDASLAALTAGSLLPAMQVDSALARLADLGLVIRSADRAAVASMSLRLVLELLLQPAPARSRTAAFLAAAAPLYSGDLSWLGRERSNILEAIRTLQAEGQAAQAGALARAIQPLVVLRGLWGTWSDVIELATEAAQKSGDRALAAWALHERGTRAGLLGDRDTAARALDQALRQRKRLGDQQGIAATRHNLAYLDLLPPGTPRPQPLRERLRRLPRRTIIWGAVAALLLGAGAATTLALIDYTPKAVGDSRTTTEDQAVSISVLANDTPRRGQLNPSTLSIVAGPAHGVATVSAAAHEIRYNPGPNFFGEDHLTYQICDDRQDCARADVSITVAPVNDLPVAPSKVAQTAEDTPVTIDLLAGASDIEDQHLTAAADSRSKRGGLVVLAGGTSTYTPPPNFFGTDSFAYTVSDSDGGRATAQVTITVVSVNDPPVARSDTEATLEDTALTIPLDRLLGQASDVDSDTLMLSQAGPTSAHGGMVALAGDAVTYTPAANFNGIDAFDYTISDGHSGSATATVTVTVSAVNDPPAADDDAENTNEDTQLAIPIAALIARATDVDGDTLTLTEVSSHSSKKGNVAISGDRIIYTPAANFNGTDTFTYTISDGHGGSATATVAVTVASINDPPVAKNDAAVLDEDTQQAIDVLQNDSDIDGQLNRASLRVTAGPQHGKTTIDSRTGQITYAPGPNFNGTDRFTYRVCDRGGLCDSATVNITINPVNDPPVAKQDAAMTNEDTPTTIDVLQNDSDIDGQLNRASLRVTAGPQHGKTTIDSRTGQITYAPGPNFNGADRFTYQVCDDGGACAEATVNITVTPVNDPPVAVNDTARTREATPVTIDVLKNDSDPENDINPASVRVTSGPAHGTAVIDSRTGKITYSPNACPLCILYVPNFVGTDHFTYQVCDSGKPVLCATASVTVTVEDKTPPQPPIPLATPNRCCPFQIAISLDWNAVGDPSGVSRYEWVLEIYTSATTTRVFASGSTAGTSVQVTVPCSEYRWRVRAVDGAGNVGNYSAYTSFAITCPPS